MRHGVVGLAAEGFYKQAHAARARKNFERIPKPFCALCAVAGRGYRIAHFVYHRFDFADITFDAFQAFGGMGGAFEGFAVDGASNGGDFRRVARCHGGVHLRLQFNPALFEHGWGKFTGNGGRRSRRRRHRRR